MAPSLLSQGGMIRRTALSALVAALTVLVHGADPAQAAPRDLPASLPSPAGGTSAVRRGESEGDAILANRLRAEGRPLEAALYLRRALRAAGGREKARIYFELAETYFAARYFHEAALYCRLCLRACSSPDLAASARLLLAESLCRRGFFAEAAREFARSGKTPEALFGRANALQRMGKTKEATRAYEHALAADPAYPERSEETRCLLGENLAGFDPERAGRYLLTVNGEPFRGRAALALGAIALAGGSGDKAAAFFRRALGSGDRQVRRLALFRLAEASEAVGDAREAAARLEELRVQYPHSPESLSALVRLARLRRKERNYAAAASLLGGVLAARSAECGAEAVEEAVALLGEVEGKDPAVFARLLRAVGPALAARNDENTLMKLAQRLEGAGPAAAPLFERLARSRSLAARTRGLLWLARRAAMNRDGEGARRLLEEAKRVRMAPKDLGRIEAAAALAAGDRRGAARAFLSLGALCEDDIPLFADVFEAAGDRRKAAALFKEAAARFGAGSAHLVRLADLLYEEGDMRGALAGYQAALAKDPGNEWAAYRAGLLEEGPAGDALLEAVRKDRILARAAAAALRGRRIEEAVKKQ